MDLRLPTEVKSVVQVETGPSGGRRVRTLHKEKKSKKKKGSSGVREVERMVRLCSEAQQAASDAYLERHNESNRKKRDGWLRDFGYNVLTAEREYWKKLRKMAKL